ncbi:MAG: leucine-rich repeat domain-containing protein [Oscillospiraceae bacterium]|nr:leucine-rich repeat domain-containing protein [Oscillospiraceae bacterium]
MTKRILTLILTLCLAVVAMTVMAFADIAFGTDWVLDGDGTLTISSWYGMCDWMQNGEIYRNRVISVIIDYDADLIEMETFASCTNMTSVTIPDSVTVIGLGAFQNCKSLTTIDLPAGLTTIGDSAFAGCEKLESISIPNGVTTIYASAFSGCKSLKSITIPGGVTSIDAWTFENCTSLKSIIIPSGVTSIGYGAFSRCSSLTSVVIPESVTSIEIYAFNHCTAITDIYYAGSESDWSNIAISASNDPLTDAFIHYNSSSAHEHTHSTDFVWSTDYSTCTVTIGCSGCSSTKELDCIVTSEAGTTVSCTVDGTTMYTATATINAEAYIDSKTETIAATGHTTEIKYAKDATCTEDGYTGDTVCTVCGETVSTGTVIPAAGHNYVNHVCTGCGELDCIAFGTDWVLEFDGTLTISSDDGMEDWTKNTSTYADEVITVDIASGVTYIEDRAFLDCANMTSVLIPDTVTSIGINAFYSCDNLVAVDIPNSVLSIGNGAFMFCISLEKVTIGNSVTTIGLSAFHTCKSLKTITIPSSVQSIDSNAFRYCSSLESVTLESCATTLKASVLNDTPAYNNNNITINHTAAEAVKESEVAATCTTDGSYDSVVYCSVCGEELSRETITVPATGHSYEAVVTDPTCTEDGYTTYTCSACGDSYVADETEALGHSYYAISWNWEADYSGATVIIGCHNCDHYDTEGIYSQYITVSTTPATCTEDGETVYTAEKYWFITLTDTQRVTIPATGHDYEAVVTEPTCTEGGYTTYTCSVCGDSYVADETAATGHTTEVQNAKDATCTEDGYTGDEVCTVCGETITTGEVIPATGHNYVVTAFTWNSGYKSATVNLLCTDCGEEHSEAVDADASQYMTAETTEETTDNETTEEVVISEPVEDTDTEPEPDEAEAEEPETETNPTTGIILAMLPMAIALAGVSLSKKK